MVKAKGVRLTGEEKGQIDLLHKQRYSNRKIAKSIGKSHSVVNYYLSETKLRKEKKKPGVKSSLDDRTIRHIQREASETGASTTSIKRKLGLTSSKSTLYRVIIMSPYLKSRAYKKKPSLSAVHRAARLAWAHARMHWVNEWKNIIWSDEKKFNSDGPDGYKHYWHDLRKDERYLSKRQQGGPSVMVWTGFGADKKCNIAFLTGKVNALKYQNTLAHHFLPFRQSLHGKQVVFQQDNASIHTARSTSAWFLANNVAKLPWPSKSPDLNPMENVWGILARRVYADGKQYSTQAELKAAITAAWDSISSETLDHFVQSMPSRVFAVINKNGASTKY